ncbi:MAG: hypothetical protein HY360_03600, partial [Verrucomicrobia bacterium]|nr:hypothetical protein [Verrucomicrobiota bacterium]
DIVSDYLRRGGKPADYPFKIPALKQRILNALASSRHPCFETKPPRYAQDAEGRWVTTYVSMREIARKYTETLSQGTESAPLPEPIRSMPP